MTSIARIISMALVVASCVVVTCVSEGKGAELDGTVKLGTIIKDETGDQSSMQETYNIFDGFSVSQIRLTGNLNPRNYFTLNLREINLDSRKADFTYRVPSVFEWKSSLRQNQYIYDRNGNVTTKRKHWQTGVVVNPVDEVSIVARYSWMDRAGDRLSFPLGTQNLGGSRVDYLLQGLTLEGQLKKGRRGGALTYRMSDYNDRIYDFTDRRGQVVSLRVHTPGFVSEDITHVARVAYGDNKLRESGLDYTLANFQYTGIWMPKRSFEFKYNFFASRIDDQGSTLATDNIRNDFNLLYRYQYGSFWGGYTYETNDDNFRLTNYNIFRVGAYVKAPEGLTVRIDYRGNYKTDTEKQTLLQDIEDNRFKTTITYKLNEDITFGGKYNTLFRRLPDINVDVEGRDASAFGKFYYEYFGDIGIIASTLTLDYTFQDYDYDDRVGAFHTKNHFIGARLDVDYEETFKLFAGVAYTDVSEDLDIEKGVFTIGGEYTFREKYIVEAKYGGFSYDDFVLIGRYYTANVVWLNVGYNFGTN